MVISMRPGKEYIYGLASDYSITKEELDIFLNTINLLNSIRLPFIAEHLDIILLAAILVFTRSFL